MKRFLGQVWTADHRCRYLREIVDETLLENYGMENTLGNLFNSHSVAIYDQHFSTL